MARVHTLALACYFVDDTTTGWNQNSSVVDESNTKGGKTDHLQHPEMETMVAKGTHSLTYMYTCTLESLSIQWTQSQSSKNVPWNERHHSIQSCLPAPMTKTKAIQGLIQGGAAGGQMPPQAYYDTIIKCIMPNITYALPSFYNYSFCPLEDMRLD